MPVFVYDALALGVGNLILFWLLVALAVLDAEHLWLPDSITLPGSALGFFFVVLRGTLSAAYANRRQLSGSMKYAAEHSALDSLLSIVAAAGLILLIRWIYWLIRRREGIGLGDAKLMAMLAAWLGLPGALLSFGLAVVLAAIAALVLLVLPSTREKNKNWAQIKLPLGTFLCVGGIVSSLWGQQMIGAYLRWAGF